MRITNNNPLDLVGQDGETISIEIAPVQGAASQSLNGAVFAGSSFMLDSASAPAWGNEAFYYAVGCLYGADEGGSCEVRLTGSVPNEDTAIYQMTQTPGEARDAASFTINIQEVDDDGEEE